LFYVSSQFSLNVCVCVCVVVIIQVARLKMLAYKSNAEALFPIYDGMKNLCLLYFTLSFCCSLDFDTVHQSFITLRYNIVCGVHLCELQ